MASITSRKSPLPDQAHSWSRRQPDKSRENSIRPNRIDFPRSCDAQQRGRLRGNLLLAIEESLWWNLNKIRNSQSHEKELMETKGVARYLLFEVQTWLSHLWPTTISPFNFTFTLGNVRPRWSNILCSSSDRVRLWNWWKFASDSMRELMSRSNTSRVSRAQRSILLIELCPNLRNLELYCRYASTSQDEPPNPNRTKTDSFVLNRLETLKIIDCRDFTIPSDNLLHFFVLFLPLPLLSWNCALHSQTMSYKRFLNAIHSLVSES